MFCAVVSSIMFVEQLSTKELWVFFVYTMLTEVCILCTKMLSVSIFFLND